MLRHLRADRTIVLFGRRWRCSGLVGGGSGGVRGYMAGRCLRRRDRPGECPACPSRRHSAHWFGLHHRGGDMMLHHRTLNAVIMRDWSREMELFASALEISANTTTKPPEWVGIKEFNAWSGSEWVGRIRQRRLSLRASSCAPTQNAWTAWLTYSPPWNGPSQSTAPTNYAKPSRHWPASSLKPQSENRQNNGRDSEPHAVLLHGLRNTPRWKPATYPTTGIERCDLRIRQPGPDRLASRRPDLARVSGFS